MVWRAEDPQGAECAKIRHRIVRYTNSPLVLDLGAGPWKAWPHFVSVDNLDEWQAADPWRPDIAADVTKLDMFADRSVDAVFSSHLLEHIEDTEATLREWWRVIKPLGYLILYLPHKEFYPNIGQEGSNPDHKHDFLPTDIMAVMEKMPGGWDLLESENRNDWREYSFFQVYQKLQGTKRRHSWQELARDTRKKCLVVRYGGVGDCIQAASIFPGLKEQGYKVIFQTVEHGEQVCRHDPHVDEIHVQGRNQVPQEDLQHFWEAWEHDVDHAINLCESVEVTLLGRPGDRTHAMNQPARHMLMDVNYNEFAHAMADVPLPVRQNFYPLPEEVAWAEQRRSRYKNNVFGLCLMGSSPHKVWPYLADLLMEIINSGLPIKIMSLGGKGEQVMEYAAVNKLVQTVFHMTMEDALKLQLSEMLTMLKNKLGFEPLICQAGRMDLRQAGAFMPFLDGLIGPETGLMNMMALDPVPKLMLLSHSSHENLTKHWTNTTVIHSHGCAQSPCHRLHHDFKFCFKDEETAAALCSAAVKARDVAHWIFNKVSEKVYERETRTVA